MATKLGEAYVEITARDAGLKRGLGSARRMVDDATKKPAVFSLVGQFREAAGAVRQLSGEATNLRARLFQAVPGSVGAENLKIALDDTNKRLQLSKQHLNDLAGAWQRYGAIAAVALAAIILGLRNIAQAGMEAQDSSVKLMASLASTGQLSEGAMASLQDYATAMMNKTVYDDEAVKSGMALMASIGVQRKDMEAATKTAIAFAAVTKGDIQDAFMQVGRAAVGGRSMLKQWIPAMKEAKTVHEQLAIALEWGASRFRIAEAEARTTGGQFKQFAVSVGELKEALATTLLPVLALMVAPFKAFVDWLARVNPIVGSAIVAVIGLGGVIAALVMGVGALAAAWSAVAKMSTIAAIAQLAASNKVAAIAVITAAITAATLLINNQFASAQKAMKDMLAEYQKTQAKIKPIRTEQDKMAQEEWDKKQRESATESARLAREAEEREKNRRDSFAHGLIAEVNLWKQKKEAEEQAQRAAIGWSSLGDAWKQAMTAGAMQRFGGPANRQGGWTNWGRGDISQEFGRPIVPGVSDQTLFQMVIELKKQTLQNDELIRRLGWLAPALGV